jgi:hypothetical protein
VDEAAQPTPPTLPTDAPPPDVPDRGRRALLLVVVLALVAVFGIAAWSIGDDDAADRIGREEERFPTPTTVSAPTTVPATTAVPAPSPPSSAAGSTAPAVPATEPAATDPPVATTEPTSPPTVAPTTEGPDAPPTTPSPSTPDEPESPDVVAGLVPNLAAFPEPFETPERAQVAIDELLASGRHDVAAVGPAGSICAAVRLDQPLAVDSRWERDGRRIASSDLGRRDAPGFGECLGNDGDPLDDGSYQYVVIDSRGEESAAGGIVIGATRVEQAIRNVAAEPICAIRVAPSISRYFEVYVYDAAPVAPGATATVPVADVRQDAQLVGCGADDPVLERFSFDPDAATPQPPG